MCGPNTVVTKHCVHLQVSVDYRELEEHFSSRAAHNGKGNAAPARTPPRSAALGTPGGGSVLSHEQAMKVGVHMRTLQLTGDGVSRSLNHMLGGNVRASLARAAAGDGRVLEDAQMHGIEECLPTCAVAAQLRAIKCAVLSTGCKAVAQILARNRKVNNAR